MEETDKLTNTFSEEGRIHQVEYAIKGVHNAGPAIGVLFRNGVFLLGKNTDDAVSLVQDEKIYVINSRTAAVVGGLYADSNLLVNYVRVKAQDYLRKYSQEMPAHLIAKTICKIKQKFTQGGGMRPFGVSFIIAGCDDDKRWKMYVTNPSGTMTEWRACLFGEGEKNISAVLDTLPENCEMEDAIVLAFRALSATSEGALKNTQSITGMLMYTREESKRHVMKEMSQREIQRYLELAKNRER